MPHSVLMASASPKLLIEDACLKLQVKHVVGTELIPYKGRHIIEQNCPGQKSLIKARVLFQNIISLLLSALMRMIWNYCTKQIWAIGY